MAAKNQKQKNCYVLLKPQAFTAMQKKKAVFMRPSCEALHPQEKSKA